MPRRQFLGSSARAGLAAVAAPAMAANWIGEARSADIRSEYAVGSYGLELDGAFAGPLSSYSGGNVVSDVIVLKPGPDGIRRKHVGAPRIEPITIESGLPMTKLFYDWIKSSIEPNPKFLRKSGAIIGFDTQRAERRRLSFSNALISAVQFPSCEASSKQPARLSVTFTPGTVALTAGKGTSSAQHAARLPGLLSSAFRMRIKGLESATARVTRIEPIRVSVANVTAPVGELRDYERLPTTIDVGNLAMTVDEGSLAPIQAWHEDFVVKGNSGPERERVGVLEYLSTDGRSTLMTLNLFNLGIFRIGPDAAASQDPRAMALSKVEMYCQTIGVDFGIDLKP
jgi:hypothetical protein